MTSDELSLPQERARTVRGEQAYIGVAESHLAELVQDLGAVRAAGPSGYPTPQDWAYVLCAKTREIHLDVWDWQPFLAMVIDVVIPELIKAEEAVRQVPENKKHRTGRYADNIAARVTNLGRYVRGEDSAFAPGDRNPAQKTDENRK